MKNLKYILLIAFIFSSLSCSKEDLEVEPVNEFLSENFYQTEDQVFSALVAAYDPIGWTMAFGQWVSEVMFNEIRSDNANAGGDPSDNDQPGWQEFDDFTNTNTNTVIHAMYRRFYIGIFRANLVIFKPEISSPLVDRYQAEAKFLRAYYHFELLKHFGPIPVVTQELTPEDVNLSRNTLTEVFTAIEQDLTEAIAVLPVSISSAETGRATRGAAQALLGKVYLYWGDMLNDDVQKFDAAASQLGQVIQSGIYGLEDEFESLFLFGVKNPSESVFEIQKTNLYPSDWGWFEGIEGNGMVQLCGVRGLCSGHPEYQDGWGFMLPTQALWDFYLPDDLYRRDVAMMSEAELAQEIQDAGVSGCNPVVDITQSNPVDFTGYWQEKFANYKAYEGNNVNGGDPNLTKDDNIYAIRYADVLLMMAEALHRGSGSDQEAKSYIDIVRERAAGPGQNTDFRTADDLMSDLGWSLQDIIWYERRAELAMEGDRWFDLVRSGRANASLFAGDPIRGSNFSDIHLWLPIALEETSVAPSLTEYPDQSLFQ
ncbi:MAG: RagB/SusD family nutrient uptake outer membrane protein [Saprospiraceae bacterium]|nr:RagB/SusD family nutrient uptake outer membrane protein [Saprospiraceae bacterium]